MIGLKPMPRKKANTFITLASVELQKGTNWKELLPARVDKDKFICEPCYEEKPKTISKCSSTFLTIFLISPFFRF